MKLVDGLMVVTIDVRRTAMILHDLRRIWRCSYAGNTAAGTAEE